MPGLLSLLACVRDPVDRWLEDVARGNDADAFAALDVVEPPPGGFDLGRFGKRADRIGIRRVTDVTWERRTRRGAQLQRVGTAVLDGRTVPIELRADGM